MTKVSAAKALVGGKVDRPAHPSKTSEMPMTANSATAARVRTGGPEDNGPKILEHAMGWVLVVVVAMLVTQLGLL